MCCGILGHGPPRRYLPGKDSTKGLHIWAEIFLFQELLKSGAVHKNMDNDIPVTELIGNIPDPVTDRGVLL